MPVREHFVGREPRAEKRSSHFYSTRAAHVFILAIAQQRLCILDVKIEHGAVNTAVHAVSEQIERSHQLAQRGTERLLATPQAA